MTDGVIKGSGNSRYLKSVPNFMALYPTYEAFAQALIAGTLPIDLYGINAGGWQTRGTDLNKASLLTDAVETAIWGSAANRTVSAALQQLRSLISTAQSTVNSKLTYNNWSYAGAGGGSKTLYCSNTPYLVVVVASTGAFAITTRPNSGNTSPIGHNSTFNSGAKATFSGKVVTFPDGINYSGTDYYCCAIGV